MKDSLVLQSQWPARIKVLQTRVNKRVDLAQGEYKREFKMKDWATPTFKPGQLIDIDKPLLVASSAGNAESLAKSS